MLKKEVIVKRKTGLQARPAAQFVQEANRFSSEIILQRENKQVNAKSIMGIMSLAVGHGAKVTLIVDGHDEEEAMEALVKFIETEK